MADQVGVTATGSGTGSDYWSSTGRTTTKTTQQFDYMKLIVAQMQNMNPMDPSSGGDSMPMMMQAESLNQLTKLNQALQDLQALNSTGYASSLIGKTVSGVDDGRNAVTGTVRALRMDAGSPVIELSTGKQLKLSNLTRVTAE